MTIINNAGVSPDCEWGYTHEQIKDIMGDRLDEFGKWMEGQTMAICEGKRYNHDTKEYEEACGGVSHGLIAYQWDVQRFLNGAESWQP